MVEWVGLDSFGISVRPLKTDERPAAKTLYCDSGAKQARDVSAAAINKRHGRLSSCGCHLHTYLPRCDPKPTAREPFHYPLAPAADKATPTRSSAVETRMW